MRSLVVCIVLLLTSFSAAGAQTRNVPVAIRDRIANLPTKLTELYRVAQTDLGGSTESMMKGLMSISAGLLEDAVVLQSYVTKQSFNEVRKEIERDQEAIIRSVEYERNAEGWGGTIARIDASAAALTHIENLLSFYVTRIHDNDGSLELKNWYSAWRKAAKRDN